MAETNKLERMNFFRGFFTTAEDWRAEQKYHRDKLRLHNEWQHDSPGIIRGQLSELEVEPGESPGNGQAAGASAAASLILRVQPGVAVDAHGNMLILDAPRTLRIDPEVLGDSPELLVYVTIAYAERETSWVDNFEQPDYSGYKRITEAPALAVTTTEPDNRDMLELARIRLQAGVQEITPAPAAPEPGQPAGANQIDRSHVVWALAVARLVGELDVVRQQLEEARGQVADLSERLARLGEGYGWLNYYRLLHSRGLGTPGVVAAIPEGLRVEPAGGSDVRVLPGVAMDAQGNVLELHTPRVLRIDPKAYELPDTVFVVARYAPGYDPSRPPANRQPANGGGETEGSGQGPGAVETIDLRIDTNQPDNATGLELARVNLVDANAPIAAPDDPEHPGGNQLDLRHILIAGAVGVRDPELAAETRDRVIQLMHRTRRDFAALGRRFPVTSEADVRHACLTVETVLRTGRVGPGRLPQVLRGLAAVQRDVGQELADKYGEALRSTHQYLTYMDAVRDLEGALQRGNEGQILNAGEALASAARELSEVIVKTPVAEAGNDIRIGTPGEEAVVTLNAGGSWSREGRAIDWYIWEKVGEGEASGAGASRGE